MYKFLKALLLLFIFCLGNSLYAQTEDDFNSETIFGINLNTNGGLIGGGIVRHSRILTPSKNLNFGLEIVNVKHPNEYRISTGTGSIYVVGKKNYLLSFRPQVGLEYVLFTKGKEDGVQVNVLFNGGPTIGVVKPYYIQFYKNGSIETVAYDEKVHNPATQLNNIVGSAGFFQGFEGTKIVPGIQVKAGINFEFSSYRHNLSGIEAGFLLEAFPYKIDLLEVSSSFETYNRSKFSSLYINIYFGGRR